jgi:hypothetical protein
VVIILATTGLELEIIGGANPLSQTLTTKPPTRWLIYFKDSDCVFFSHVSYEGNFMVDVLAKQGVSRESEFVSCFDVYVSIAILFTRPDTYLYPYFV